MGGYMIRSNERKHLRPNRGVRGIPDHNEGSCCWPEADDNGGLPCREPGSLRFGGKRRRGAVRYGKDLLSG
ncbi:hypothetical protein J6590_043081 [Homalodisca vitripennis]|nr:hypothetical protein J6590_043081 [Homalodisca vitripennis]